MSPLVLVLLVAAWVTVFVLGPVRWWWQEYRERQAVLQAHRDSRTAERAVRQIARQAQLEMLRILMEHRRPDDRR